MRQQQRVQTAAKLVLEPISEADLDPAAHGYRPGRSGTDAIQAVHALLCRGADALCLTGGALAYGMSQQRPLWDPRSPRAPTSP
jgi:hypothetical protein